MKDFCHRSSALRPLQCAGVFTKAAPPRPKAVAPAQGIFGRVKLKIFGKDSGVVHAGKLANSNFSALWHCEPVCLDTCAPAVQCLCICLDLSCPSLPGRSVFVSAAVSVSISVAVSVSVSLCVSVSVFWPVCRSARVYVARVRITSDERLSSQKRPKQIDILIAWPAPGDARATF